MTPHDPTRREWLCNVLRVGLLRWRMVRRAALPAWGTACLAALDRWALRLHGGGER